MEKDINTIIGALVNNRKYCLSNEERAKLGVHLGRMGMNYEDVDGVRYYRPSENTYKYPFKMERLNSEQFIVEWLTPDC